MTQVPAQGPVIEVKPQPNVYTVLLFVAVVILAVTIGVVLWKLMSVSGYGLSFGEVLSGPKAVAK